MTTVEGYAVTATDQRRNLDEQRLIERHIDPEPDRYGGRADARLKVSGVPVWAIVAYLGVFDGDVDKVAHCFELTEEEIDAALAYYRRNKPQIDARVILNQA